MAKLSDIIEDFIKDMLENTQKSQVEIKRNELANYFGCAPSQINYVLTTRFTMDKGYYVESRRGGGGFILIRRISFNDNRAMIDMISEKIGESLTYDAACGILDSLFDLSMITERELNIIKVSLNDRVLGSGTNKNRLRAEIVKAILTIILN
ncbi:MAG: transcriptional repressor, CtsR [Firmicutes bacterium]|nr:transcriptional repressor, CtsR [Bacillota bacterium]